MNWTKLKPITRESHRINCMRTRVQCIQCCGSVILWLDLPKATNSVSVTHDVRKSGDCLLELVSSLLGSLSILGSHFWQVRATDSVHGKEGSKVDKRRRRCLGLLSGWLFANASSWLALIWTWIEGRSAIFLETFAHWLAPYYWLSYCVYKNIVFVIDNNSCYTVIIRVRLSMNRDFFAFLSSRLLGRLLLCGSSRLCLWFGSLLVD
mmetsp:Transcript_3533/g.7824  ORF Transcript_3533/g.7824 Transcript_3533/m.7824 type:complete len:207 (-) Transcript_3533:672-1292(-)